MSSCFNNEEDNKPTPEQLKMAMNEMQGTYKGTMLYYFSEDPLAKPDTLKNVQWTVDSLLTIKNFPVSMLAKSFTSRTESDFLTDIKALPATDLKCDIAFYDVKNEGFTLDIIPRVITFKARAGEKVRACKLYFLNHNNRSLGVYKRGEKCLAFGMVTYGLMRDGAPLDNGMLNRSFFKLVSTAKH